MQSWDANSAVAAATAATTTAAATAAAAALVRGHVAPATAAAAAAAAASWWVRGLGSHQTAERARRGVGERSAAGGRQKCEGRGEQQQRRSKIWLSMQGAYQS
jgi:hypothetical protein